MIALWLALLVQSPTATPAPVDPACASPPRIENPNWVRRPTGQDVLEAYPLGAGHKGLSGEARIRCIADAKGRMTKCQLLSETPADLGFGQAALSLAGKFRLDPTIKCGLLVEGAPVTIPIAFRLN
jgi:protein TonB